MDSGLCSKCRNLSSSALDRNHRPAIDIHTFTIRASAARCPYCKIIWDGLEAFGFGEQSMIFSYSTHRTFSLTRKSIVASYWLEPMLEYYLAPEESQGPDISPSDGNGDVSPALDAIRPRPAVVRFWQDALRTQLMGWVGEPRQGTILPKRVLDLGEGSENRTRDLSLLETQTTVGTYVALSHCWVKRDILKTTKATISDHSSGIAFNNLPATFQEAIMVCRWFGVQYLWIDSLCIVQDDTVDWEEQASNMDMIYENAFFTLAAHGYSTILPDPRECELALSGSVVQAKIRVRKIPIHTFLSPQGVVLGGLGEKASNEISGRGWCYQERLLASQVLHFTPFEILHEDAEGRIKCQCGNDHAWFLPDIRRPTLKDDSDPPKLWMKIVEQYSQRGLTRQWDLLPGLAGVARRFQNYHQPGQYFAGLWTKELARWLCWRSKRQPLWGSLNSGCDTCGHWPRRLQEPLHSAGYIVPSFSWASRFGPCGFLADVWRDAFQQKAKIIQLQCTSADRNPWGRFTSCSIEIRGIVLNMEVISTVGKDRKFVNTCRTEYSYLVFPSTQSADAAGDIWFEAARAKGFQYVWDAIDDIPADGQPVKVLELFRGKQHSVAIVLQAREAPHVDKKLAYRRIGICTKLDYHPFGRTTNEDPWCPEWALRRLELQECIMIL